MRVILGGLLAFFLLAVSSAQGQISGRVDSIGLGGQYRPGCWTPMLVQLTPVGAPTDYYEIRVWQHDLDGDLVYYATRISLTAGAGEQPFWTYFIPEPVHGGLTSDVSTAAELAHRLRITVHDKTGKELTQVPLGSVNTLAIDPPGGNDRERGTRYVLFIGSASAPPLDHYAHQRIIGIKENLNGLKLSPDRLPESALGYDGVDAVVWLEGDPAQLGTSGGRRFDAFRDYVRRGGHLVICTPVQWQGLAGFDDLLPVDIQGIDSDRLQSPLRDLAGNVRYKPDPKKFDDRTPWDRFGTTLNIAIARPRPGAVVDLYSERVANPQTDADLTPWLVRKPYGFGCVSWVAQDLGDRIFVNRANWGWPAVWEEVLGTRGQPAVDPTNDEKARWNAGGVVDLGYTLLEAMNLTGRGAKLVGVTILFFIGYWVVVGPGAFFWLRYKGRPTLNWFAFGTLALVATAITLGMVRLILRGDPEIRHVSLVRIDADRRTPATVISDIGIYVPRDGAQRIEVTNPAVPVGGIASPALFAPTITPYPIHPAHHMEKKGDNYLFPAPRQYRVNVPAGEAADAGNAVADVPFRTTMKRLEATWSGPMDARIDGTARLAMAAAGSGYIAGTLTNLTGVDLANIYVAFRYQTPGGVPTDYMMHVPRWASGAKLDLGAAFNPPPGKETADISIVAGKRPNAEFPVRGRLADWSQVLAVSPGTFGVGWVNDLGNAIPYSVPMLSFFDRLPVTPRDALSERATRADYRRFGAREWDVSSPLMAGKLVIVAQANDTALPMPLTIDAAPPAGRGTTIFQFILPLEPMPVAEPATQPTTQSATQSAARP